MKQNTIKNRMAERASKIDHKENIYSNITIQNKENVYPAEENLTEITKNDIPEKPELLKKTKEVETTHYNLSIPVFYHKFLRVKALDEDTNVRALIIKALEIAYPDLNK